MSATGRESPPDPELIEQLAERLATICCDHSEAWGHGSKPLAEAVAALGFAFATVTYQEREIPGTIRALYAYWRQSVTMWWQVLERLEKQAEAQGITIPGERPR